MAQSAKHLLLDMINTMVADGLLLTNHFLELDDTPWAGVFGEDQDEAMAAMLHHFLWHIISYKLIHCLKRLLVV